MFPPKNCKECDENLMARLPRYAMPGYLQHVIHRGRYRSPLFSIAEDFQYFWECLKRAQRQYQADVHAYVLMPDHIHLLLTPDRKNGISLFMQSVGVRYAKYIAKRYHRSGALWNGRYKSTLVDSDRYLFSCMRYIELNPVRAALAGEPGAYPWSSYGRNATGETDLLVTPHTAYLDLGPTNSNRCQFYRSLFNTRIPESEIRAIRVATNSGWALGGDGFKTAIRNKVNRRVDPLPRGGNTGMALLKPALLTRHKTS